MYSSVKPKPQLGRPKKCPSLSISTKTTDDVVQVPLKAENNVAKITNLSKVSNVKSKASLKLKGISIPVLYNIGEINKLKKDIRTDLNMKNGIKVQKVKPFIQQKTVGTCDAVKNDKAFTANKVDALYSKSDSVHKRIQEGEDEKDSDIIKNIRQITQQKSASTNESDIVKDIKPVINLKIVDVASAQNRKPTVQHLIDPSDDDSDIEIEEINIVTKNEEPQTMNFLEKDSPKQEEFIKTIMKQVEELETTLGSQIKQKNEALLKEREIIEQLKRKNSILEQKEQERKLSTEKYDQKTSELNKKVEKQQKCIEMLKESLKLKDEECKSAIEKLESKSSELSQMILIKENDIKLLKENGDVKEREIKLTIEKYENKTKELLKQVSQKSNEMDHLKDDLKNLKKVSEKQIKTEKETVKKLNDKHSKETAAFIKQISILEKSTREGNDSIVDLNDTIDSLNKKLAKKGDLVNELKLKVSKLISEFTKGYKDKDDQIDSKTKQIQEITGNAENLATKVSDLQKEVTVKVNEIQIIKQEKEVTDAEIDNLKQELSITMTDLAAKNAMNSRQVNLIADLSKTVSNLENDIAAKAKEILSLKKDLTIKVNDLETKNIMNKRQSRLLEEISKNLDDITKDKNNLEKSHILIKMEHQDLVTKFQNIEQSYKQTCFVKKQLQERLSNIKTKTANKIALTDNDIFEDKLEQTFYNSKRNYIAETLMTTYNWPILSVEVDPRVLKKSKNEDKIIAFKQYYIQGVPLMVTYLWPIVPRHTGRGFKRRNEDNQDNSEFCKKLRLSHEGKEALDNAAKVEVENLSMLMCNGPILSADGDLNMVKTVKIGDENQVNQSDDNTRSLMLTYLWPVVPFHTRFEAKTPNFRGLKRSSEENEGGFVMNKMLKASMEADSVFLKRKLLEESRESKRIKLDKEVIEEDHMSIFVSEILQYIITDML